MLKRIIPLILALMLFACASAETATNGEDPVMNRIIPTWDNVKPLGRTAQLEGALWMAFSGSGCEFTFHGAKAEITIAADTAHTSPDNRARIAIYLDGQRVVDDMLDAPEKTYVVMDESAPRDAVIRVIKLSETAMSTCAVTQIAVDSAEGIRPTAQSSRYIEFIGDSITCGYGVDDEVAEHHFTTSTEDVTRAYAYRTADALGADYSMVSISGYGIISGYTGDGETKIPAQTIPQYYNKLGFSYASFRGQTPAGVEWAFPREPDLIVVNLGTNDDSYTGNHFDRQAEYREQYVAFLKVIRRHNPNAKILCTLGIMGDRLCPSVQQAMLDYRAETGDTNVACMRFSVQLPADGYAADWHPTALTHGKAADKLVQQIRNLMRWED